VWYDKNVNSPKEMNMPTERPYTPQELKQMDEAHSRPLIVEGMRNGSDRPREFMAVANAAGLQRLRDDGQLTALQYKAILQQIPAKEEGGRYVIVFEGKDAGHLKAVRAFSGATDNELKLPGPKQFGIVDFDRTLNLSVENPIPQAVDPRIGHAGNIEIVPSGNFAPSRENAESFLIRVWSDQYSKNGPSPEMKSALALAMDPLHQPNDKEVLASGPTPGLTSHTRGPGSIASVGGPSKTG
jgi:hypothetical protein